MAASGFTPHNEASAGCVLPTRFVRHSKEAFVVVAAWPHSDEHGFGLFSDQNAHFALAEQGRKEAQHATRSAPASATQPAITQDR